MSDETPKTRPRERAGRLREGLNATARIIALGLVMDVIYQAIVFKTFYSDQALVVALALAFVPYVIIRGVTARVSRGPPSRSHQTATSAGSVPASASNAP